MEKTTKKKVRKAILGVTSVALVAGVTSAITMAMLSDRESAENTFTASPELSLDLLEPKWDGTTEEIEGVDPGQLFDPDTDGVKGVEAALSYVPGAKINKNPLIKNTSNSDEYVALRATYQVLCRNDSDPSHHVDNQSGTQCSEFGNWHTIKAADFKKYFAKTAAEVKDAVDEDGGDDTVSRTLRIVKEYDDENFVLDSTEWADYYYYTGGNAEGKLKILAQDMCTSSVFNYVVPLQTLDQCDDSADGDQHMFKLTGCESCKDGGALYQEPLLDYGENANHDRQAEVVILIGNQQGLPEFRIVVTAAAVQTENITSDEAKVALKNCFPAITNKENAFDK